MAGQYSPSHSKLVTRAKVWLNARHYKCILTDPNTQSCAGEWPEAIGWKCYHPTLSCLIEVKVTRSDFTNDKKKPHRAPEIPSMGDLRYYMCPPGLINTNDLPAGWGLLWCYPKQIRVKQDATAVNPVCKSKEASLLASELNLWVQGYRTPGKLNK